MRSIEPKRNSTSTSLLLTLMTATWLLRFLCAGLWRWYSVLVAGKNVVSAIVWSDADGCIQRHIMVVHVPMTKLSGGEALVKSLLANGVDTVFGLPGGQTYHFFDAVQKEGNALAVFN